VTLNRPSHPLLDCLPQGGGTCAASAGSLLLALTTRLSPLDCPRTYETLYSAFPEAVNPTTYATIDTPTWYDFKKTKGGLEELVREIAPGLTGLSRAQLEALGYSVVDADTDQTLVSLPPAVAAQGFCRPSASDGSWRC
jgi:hypothetical protein